jgi:hypothetical protein
VPYKLHIPGEPSRALRWTVHDSRSSYGAGVLVFRNGRDLLDGLNFRHLRDTRGAWLETDRPDRARAAMGLLQDESLGRPIKSTLAE